MEIASGYARKTYVARNNIHMLHDLLTDNRSRVRGLGSVLYLPYGQYTTQISYRSPKSYRKRFPVGGSMMYVLMSILGG